MSISPPLKELPIARANSGFYEGFNTIVTIGSKALIGLIIVWAIASPEQAGAVLGSLKSSLMGNFGTWYMYVMAFYVVACLLLALWPASGKIKLGQEDESPEFSNFSWVSMMFGAGIGIGMLTYATAEPLYHFGNNPSVIMGLVEGNTVENVRPAFQWSFVHWGLSAWGCYALTGLALAFYSYNRGLPLTIRSGVSALFGKSLSGPLGHVIDIASVVATILGVSVTIGYGVSQFASGLHNISGVDWLMDQNGTPTFYAMIFSLIIVMGASTLSALSGVGKGIKWLSNINMILSLFVLLFFLIFGATNFAISSFFIGLWDYIVNVPSMITTVWLPDGTEEGDALAGWQSGWTIFYWAWWIAFAPFVGLFLARISRGRTVREYILGAMIIPSIMCFVWFALAGGTAIELELSGVAQGQIKDAAISSQLFAMINIMLSEWLAVAMSAVIVVLLLTYLVTSADSAVLIINTINSAGDESKKGKIHIIIWGAVLTLVIGGLLGAGGLAAINTAMIIGALPFSFILALMGISVIKSIVRDGMRRAQGDK